MASLVPSGALESLPRTAAVDVADAGDTYRVRLTVSNTQRVRVYRDVARDCEQRARFAAVFVVLTLMPPELLIETPKLPAAEPPSPEPVRPSRRPRSSLWTPRRGACASSWQRWATPRPRVLSAPEMTGAGGELRAAIGGRAPGRAVCNRVATAHRLHDRSVARARATDSDRCRDSLAANATLGGD